MDHVFLSHSSQDRASARSLLNALEGRGLQLWMAPRDVPPGCDYSECLQDAIEACGALVVIISPQSNASQHVRAEVELAFSLRKPIFPVRYEDVKPAKGLGLFLSLRHWTDLFGEDADRALDALERELKRLEVAQAAPVSPLLAKPVAEPEPPSALSSPPRSRAKLRAAMIGVPLLAVAGIAAVLAWPRPASIPVPPPAPVAPTPAPTPSPAPTPPVPAAVERTDALDLADANDRRAMIVNGGSRIIMRLQAAGPTEGAAEGAQWGQDLIPDRYLSPGEGIVVNFGQIAQRCEFRLRAVDQSNAEMGVLSVNVCRNSKYTFAGT